VGGRFLVETTGDVVLVVQEGFFETMLEEQFLVRLEEVTTLASQKGGFFLLSDVRQFDGTSMMGKIRFERWARRNANRIRRTVIVSENTMLKFLLSVSASIVPSFLYSFARTPEEGLSLVGRAELTDWLEQTVREGRWFDGSSPTDSGARVRSTSEIFER
jgi:hypothetical protein